LETLFCVKKQYWKLYFCFKNNIGNFIFVSKNNIGNFICLSIILNFLNLFLTLRYRFLSF